MAHKPIVMDTLGALLDIDISTGTQRWHAYCEDCLHSALIDVETLAAKLGRECPLDFVAARLRCTACGSTKVSTRFVWHLPEQ